MSRGFAFSHVLLCKIFNVHCGSTSEIFSVARKGRKQVSTCGHKFSMLEKLLSTQSSLLGQALVGAKPLHLLSQTALPLESPTGAFIASQPWPFPKPCFSFAPLVRKRRVFLHGSSIREGLLAFTGGQIWLKRKVRTDTQRRTAMTCREIERHTSSKSSCFSIKILNFYQRNCMG